MDTSNVLSLIEQLDDEVDDLEECLEPLISTALSETSHKLPLLDKAKLYVLVTYAIESLLFCNAYCIPLILHTNDLHSISAAQWRQSSRAFCFYRVNSGQTIL